MSMAGQKKDFSSRIIAVLLSGYSNHLLKVQHL